MKSLCLASLLTIAVVHQAVGAVTSPPKIGQLQAEPVYYYSPPVLDNILSVRRIERFNVAVGPTGIISIVAIFFPQHMAAWETSNPRKYRPVNPVAPHVSFLPRVTCGS